ncbi:unnamed protein product [Peniophora sp. CBMAI 1063]|nr:unnamed protein product [Peniophora sp. CBMAI 1063]
MKTGFIALPAVLAPLVAAQAASIAAGQTAHVRSEINSTLCMGTVDAAASSASLSLSTCGDGNPTDLTALTVTKGSGASSQLLLSGSSQLCVTSQNASPSSDVTVVACADDSSQLWTINSNGTVSSSGNCLTVGKAALGAPVTFTGCSTSLERQQVFNVTAADGSSSSASFSSSSSSFTTTSTSPTATAPFASATSSSGAEALVSRHHDLAAAILTLLSLHRLW